MRAMGVATEAVVVALDAVGLHVIVAQVVDEEVLDVCAVLAEGDTVGRSKCQ